MFLGGMEFDEVVFAFNLHYHIGLCQALYDICEDVCLIIVVPFYSKDDFIA